MNNLKVALLYQSKLPPQIDGIIKPLKEGGYSESGADIAVAILQNNIQIITPVDSPGIKKDLDWVFPDSEVGIKKAIAKGANLFWLNTVLYTKHPILKFIDKGVLIVGQKLQHVEVFDNKFYTNNLLRENHLPVPFSYILSQDQHINNSFNFPLVIKPIRGRGSQGVLVVHNEKDLKNGISKLISSKIYGDKIMVEEFLPGKEITITVMPPGNYVIRKENVRKNNHWSFPAVERFNHIDDIAPYNGVVAVINNSKIVSDHELESDEIIEISRKCELAANIIDAKAPIRIDCRKNANNNYQIFDLNLKPNMTGSSRAHRKDQDSLTMIAASAIEWTYKDLILNILAQHWKLT